MTLFARPARFLAPLALVQFVLVACYVAAEDCVHFWDYAMYANMALNWFSAGNNHIFFQSFATKYNLLFAVPSQLGFALFGASRNVFVLTNFVVFFLAHEIAIGFVLRRVFGLGWARALLWSLTLCPLIPFMWYPLLQGYPDNSAATCLVFAFGLLLGDKKSWREMLASGALLGLSVVFRRHYAYPALAVVFTVGVVDAITLWRSPIEPFWQKVRGPFYSYTLLGLALICTLLCIEPSYIKEILTTNYTVLYKSYERTPTYFTLFFLSRLGIVVLLPMMAGLFFAFDNKESKLRPLSIVAVLAPVWLSLWAFGPAQAGDHYLITLPPVFCAVGLYGLFHTKLFKKQKRLVVVTTTLLLIGNALHAFWFSSFVLPSKEPVLSFLSSPRPPWVRNDIPQLISLASFIDSTTTESDRIVVGGSSFIFNQDLVRALFVDRLHKVDAAYRFLSAPESDGEQEPPLDVYATANVFLIASPPQYHLAPSGQKVITGLVQRFPPSHNLLSYYEKDKQTFRLMDDVIVTVWRRKEALPPALLHKQLGAIRDLKNIDRPWITLKTMGIVQHGHDPAKGDIVLFNHGGGLVTSSLFYDKPLERGNYRIKTILQRSPSCNDVSFTTTIKTPEGTVTKEKTSDIFVSEGPYYVPFKIEENKGTESYLTLSLDSKSPDGCTVALWQLQLEQMPP